MSLKEHIGAESEHGITLTKNKVVPSTIKHRVKMGMGHLECMKATGKDLKSLVEALIRYLPRLSKKVETGVLNSMWMLCGKTVTISGTWEPERLSSQMEIMAINEGYKN